MYRTPRRLWSTVVTHSCSRSTSGRGATSLSVQGTEAAVRIGAADGVTVHAGRRLEDLPAASDGGIRARRSALRFDPAVEVLARVDVHAQQHLGVLRAAILGALAEVEARLARVDPHRIRVVGNQVRLH